MRPYVTWQTIFVNRHYNYGHRHTWQFRNSQTYRAYFQIRMNISDSKRLPKYWKYLVACNACFRNRRKYQPNNKPQIFSVNIFGTLLLRRWLVAIEGNCLRKYDGWLSIIYAIIPSDITPHYFFAADNLFVPFGHAFARRCTARLMHYKIQQLVLSWTTTAKSFHVRFSVFLGCFCIMNVFIAWLPAPSFILKMWNCQYVNLITHVAYFLRLPTTFTLQLWLADWFL